VPGTRLSEYLRLWRLLRLREDVPIDEAVECSGPLYERLLYPLLLAALNIDPPSGSAALARALLLETLARSGKACRPLIARDGLGPVLIEPAVRWLHERSVEVLLEHELRGIRFSANKVSALDFGSDTVELGADDAVILAVPTHAAQTLVPELSFPRGYRAIANAHFKVEAPVGTPPIQGVLNATTEWIFAFPGRLSVTISNADRLMDVPRAMLAQAIWQEVSRITGVTGEMPAWQIVRERRATFAATPEENARRPQPRTPWRNLFLAGDWTATGLPATLEGAARSGQRAAELVASGGAL
jgi:squalene-associated FAD-dependent desaturase